MANVRVTKKRQNSNQYVCDKNIILITPRPLKDILAQTEITFEWSKYELVANS